MTDIPPDDAPVDHAARAEALERRIAELEAADAARVVRSELTAEALRAGMVDIDGLKLIDAASVVVGDDGEVKNAAAIMRDLRKAKPWLFAGAGTSSTAAAPPAQPPRQKIARDMSRGEWLAARAELLKRR